MQKDYCTVCAKGLLYCLCKRITVLFVQKDCCTVCAKGLLYCLCKRNIINNRLGNYIEFNNLLHEEQNGFCKGRNCHDHISSLYFIIENRLLKKQNTYTCFVDFRMVFDSVSRKLLWKKVQRTQCHKSTIYKHKLYHKNE